MPTTPINQTYQSNGNGKPRFSSKPQARIAQQALAGAEKREDQRVGDIADQMDEDYQVTLARRTLEANIGSIPVSFSVENGDVRAEALAKQLEDLWQRTLPTMYAAIAKGRVAYEKVWGFDPASELDVIRKLEDLPYRRTTMKLKPKDEADAGAFDGVELRGYDRNEFIDAEKTWWLALDATSMEPHGRSRYMGAPHKTWKDRNQTIKDLGLFVHKYVLDWIITRGPESKEDEQTGLTFDYKQAILDGIDLMRSGGALALSNDRDENGHLTETVEILSHAGKEQPLTSILDTQDAHQIRAFGFSEKTVTEGEKVGSFAMVKQQTILLYAVCLGILSQFADSFQRFVIDKTIAKNWFPEHAPQITLVYPKLTEQNDSFLSDLVQSILTSSSLSPIVLSGGIDIAQLLESVGIPVTADLEVRLAEALKKAQSTPVASPPGSGLFGGASLSGTLPGSSKRIPTPDDVVDLAIGELNGLLLELQDLVLQSRGGKNTDEAMRRTLRKIRHLQGDVTTAGRVLGMASPFSSALQDKPPAEGRKLPTNAVRDLTHGELPTIDLAIPGIGQGVNPQREGDRFRFPFVEDAVRFLDSLGVTPASEFSQLSQSDQRNTFTAPGVDDEATLQALKADVNKSLASGESLYEFRQRIAGKLNATRAETETLYRTNTKRAYVQGRDNTLAKPNIGTLFPYDLYVATLDNRVRDHHESLDGVVVLRNTPEHAILKKAVSDWNCRCALIPLREADARRRGIKTMSDLPGEAVALYS